MVRQRRFDRATGGTSGWGGEENIKPSVDQRNLDIPPEPALEIQIVSEDPQEIAVREGIHKRIQAEIHHEDKKADTRAEEMLEVPAEWNEVPDMMMEDKDIHPQCLGDHKIQRGSILKIGMKFSK